MVYQSKKIDPKDPFYSVTPMTEEEAFYKIESRVLRLEEENTKLRERIKELEKLLYLQELK